MLFINYLLIIHRTSYIICITYNLHIKFVYTYRLYCHLYAQGMGNLIRIFSLNCHSPSPLSLELKNLKVVFPF